MENIVDSHTLPTLNLFKEALVVAHQALSTQYNKQHLYTIATAAQKWHYINIVHRWC